MVNASHFRTITPGILCQGTACVTVQETDDVVHCVIEPEMDSTSTFYVMTAATTLTNKIKKIVIGVNFHHPRAVVHLFGLYQLGDDQKIEIETQMNHFVSYCTSKQIWRGVLEGASIAGFSGKITVHPKAQKTEAMLSNKNLLLSQEAQINTKPILEIYADDVRCTHGATVGFLDEDALFYLQSRGIDKKSAQAMLVEGFISEVSL